MNRALLLALTLVATAGTLEAQDVLTSDPTLPTTRAGTRGAAFLALGVGARAQALGGAYGAMADDISALYWNSAGIAQIDGFSAGMTTARLFTDLDIQHTFIGVVLPIGLTRLGVSVNTLDSGDMPWQSEAFPNAGFGGEQDPLRATFNWTGQSIGLHLGRPITDRLTFGGAFKFIEEGITGAKASYVAVDLGTVFRTGLYGITLGAALSNLGNNGEMRYCLKSTAHYMLWSWRFRLLSSVAAWTIPVRGWSWTSSSPTMRHAWSTWRVCAGRKGLCAWAVAGWERSGEHRGGVSSAHTVEGRPRCWREPCSTARARPCVCGFSLPGSSRARNTEPMLSGSSACSDWEATRQRGSGSTSSAGPWSDRIATS